MHSTTVADGTRVHFNSDLSGELIVSGATVDDDRRIEAAPLKGYVEARLSGRAGPDTPLPDMGTNLSAVAVKELVAETLRSELISRLEAMSDEEVLQVAIPAPTPS